MDLVWLWFALVVVCWVLFFTLEGFDFGVGVLGPLLGRDEHERGAALKTIGPFWDGNEVWLVAAIGVTYAAFPAWYAALLSGTYLPMVGVLLLLAGRGVALEFRAKHSSPRWRRRCDVALVACSCGVVALWGALLSVFVRGLALDVDGEVVAGSGVVGGLTRTLTPLATPAAGLGAVTAVVAALLLGATFLSLRTTGPLRERARRVALVALAAVGGLGVVVSVAAAVDGTPRGMLPAGAIAVVGAGAMALLVRARREALAFTGASVLVAAGVVAVVTAGLWGTSGHDGVVLASTLDPADSLTLASASATPSALRLITGVGAFAVPGVLLYQAWSYWVFRRRVASERVASEGVAS